MTYYASKRMATNGLRGIQFLRTSQLSPSVPPSAAHLRKSYTVFRMQSPPSDKRPQTLDFERQILNPERYETSKSGTDDEVAHHQASYDPSKTTPEMEFVADEEECTRTGELHHPLEVSPANRVCSEMLNPMVGGAVHGAARLGPSARGWTRKHREVHIKNVPGGPYDQYAKLLDELKKARLERVASQKAEAAPPV
ncbi:hypothetical protein FE257_002494 [Aspergillus nanangensis]|uniref:Uncharacterized protein n=1 Tax=Aspergillus nanangensis TaxID=2582783 RepID=A0AAD4CTD2_ASPNN|nr:hypothetical protein FE257_002494 [Aspergillus nanangensis]